MKQGRVSNETVFHAECPHCEELNHYETDDPTGSIVVCDYCGEEFECVDG